MIKSIILIIYATVPSGNTYWAPATYYDTMKECDVRKERIMKEYKHDSKLKVVAACANTIPEVTVDE